jgi:hypothetical protein
MDAYQFRKAVLDGETDCFCLWDYWCLNCSLSWKLAWMYRDNAWHYNEMRRASCASELSILRVPMLPAVQTSFVPPSSPSSMTQAVSSDSVLLPGSSYGAKTI